MRFSQREQRAAEQRFDEIRAIANVKPQSIVFDSCPPRLLEQGVTFQSVAKLMLEKLAPGQPLVRYIQP